MPEYYELSEMTSPEFREAAKTIKVALIPVGATEQHGPNLALATDYAVAHRLSQRLAQRLHPRAVVVPPIPFGFSHHHMSFAGTITVSPETFTAICTDSVLNVITNKIYYELEMATAVSFY